MEIRILKHISNIGNISDRIKSLCISDFVFQVESVEAGNSARFKHTSGCFELFEAPSRHWECLVRTDLRWSCISGRSGRLFPVVPRPVISDGLGSGVP